MKGIKTGTVLFAIFSLCSSTSLLATNITLPYCLYTDPGSHGLYFAMFNGNFSTKVVSPGHYECQSVPITLGEKNTMRIVEWNADPNKQESICTVEFTAQQDYNNTLTATITQNPARCSTSTPYYPGWPNETKHGEQGCDKFVGSGEYCLEMAVGW